MRKYDYLFFDLDNTIWDFESNSRVALKQTLLDNKLIEKLNSFEAYLEVYERINTELWKLYHQKKITKQTLIVERFSASLSQFGINGLNWDEINHEYLQNMALQTIIFPGSKELLNTLQEKGYKMYVITNGFTEVQYDKLRNCGLSQYFSKVYISEEIKTTKPHREIFEYALKSSNAPKKKSIMIGDSWETDILGALNFGMDQIMFLNNGKHQVPHSITKLLLNTKADPRLIILNRQVKTYFINEITELLAIV